MKCTCGAELAADARFCVKCGQPVSRGSKCAACGAELKEGAKFCGKCGAKAAVAGAVVAAAAALSCSKCGAPLAAGRKFCGKCGTPAASVSSTPVSKPVIPVGTAPVSKPVIGDAPGSEASSGGPDLGVLLSGAADKIKSGVGSVVATGSRLMGAPIRNARAKQLLFAALIVGLCILFVGFVGKQILASAMDAVLSYVENYGGLDDDLTELLAGASSRKLVALAVDVIRNDLDGFIGEITELFNSMGASMGLDSFSMALSSMFMNEVVREAFAEARTVLIEEAGPYWILLQIMAYNHELLVIGAIASAVSAVLLFLTGFKPSEFKALKMVPILVAGLGFIALLLISLLVMGNEQFLMNFLNSAA